MNYRISIVGVGGGGCKVIDCLATGLPDGASTVAINTDATELNACKAITKLQIGSDDTGGMGTGGDHQRGQAAAESDREILRALFTEVNLVFLVVALGGGTGTGAASVLLELAHEAGALVLCFATLPFDFEGTQRKAAAEDVCRELSELADTLIVVPNTRLAESVGGGSVEETFMLADQVLSTGIVAIHKLLTNPGFINLDLADLQKVVHSSSGLCTFGYGDGRGESKAEDAVKVLLKSPLLEKGKMLEGAGSLLVSIMGGDDLALSEISIVMEAINSRTRSDCHIAMGTVVDKAWQDRVTVTVLASESWGDDLPSTPRTTPTSNKAGKAVREEEAGKPKKKKPRATQTNLGLDITTSKGRFKGLEPTILNGEDLDIPTFIRRGIAIDK